MNADAGQTMDAMQKVVSFLSTVERGNSVCAYRFRAHIAGAGDHTISPRRPLVVLISIIRR